MFSFSTEVTSSQIISDNPLFQRTLKAYTLIAEKIYGDVLEIGCGEGYGLDFINKNANSVTVIDKSKSVLDKIKKKKWCESYFAQGAFYGVAYEELTKIPVPQVVVIIAVDSDRPQLFVEKRDDWIDKIWEAKKLYELNNTEAVEVSE